MTDRRMTKEQTELLEEIQKDTSDVATHNELDDFLYEYGYRKPCGSTQE